MSKLIKFFMAMAIMLIALPFGSGVVKADDNDVKDISEDYDNTYQMEFVSDSSSTNRTFDNPVTIFEKDGKIYVQMTGTGGQFIKSLTINGKEVTWLYNNEDGNFKIQFEHPEKLSDELDFGMVIAPPGMDEMEHNVPLSFIKINNVELNTPINVSSGEGVRIKSNDSFQLNIPDEFPNNVKLTIKKLVESDIPKQENLSIAGEVYDFLFDGLDGTEGSFTLSMGYDKDQFDPEQVDIYHFKQGKWVATEGNAKDGIITVQVNDFSKYGVFAKPKDEEDNNKKSPDDANKTDLLKPEKAFEIDYKILKEDGIGDSAANQYFTGKGLLFESKGNKYVHLTINNGDMVKSLSNEYDKVLVVKENSDGSIVVQLRVKDDLSDMLLSMFISVPGMYDREHSAILSFDEDSQKPIKVGDHMLVGTNNPDNKNGPFVEDGSSNELGKGNDEKGKTEEPTNSNPDKDLNPKTGDSNNIAFYVFLLVSSLISLGFLVRKRQVN